MIAELQAWADTRGYKIAWGSTSVAEDARQEISKRLQRGELDRNLYDDELAEFTKPCGTGIKNPKSVIVIAVPQPARRLLFEHENGPLETILPPTYMRYRQTYDEVTADMQANVFRGEFQAELLKAPFKSVAARLGLVTYGRNNITYVEGLGTYHQLVGVLTDADLPVSAGDRQYIPMIHPKCLECSICIDACPTGAIPEDRFLIHAERCFTLFSESPNPWPEWIKPSLERCFSAEPCLVGCLRCQAVCPRNNGLHKTKDTGVSFNAEETAWMLAGKPCNAHRVGSSINEKLERIGRSSSYPVFSKNLRELARRFIK
jgi:epoxyqueuosine reductase